MIPTARFVALAGLGLVPAALAPWVSWAGPATLAVAAALAMLLFLDRSLGSGAGRIEIERRIPARLCVGLPNAVSLRVRSFAAQPIRCILVDGWSADFGVDPAETGVNLAPFGEETVSMQVHPRSRGEFPVAPVHARVLGPLGLCWRRATLGAGTTVRVYPNLKALRRYDLLSRRRLLRTQGYRSVRRVGEGREFDQLRDYSPDDDFRSIDWKATARRGRPITRVYDTERGQNILLLLDAGRLMGAAAGSMTKLDFAVDAALMLAYVAARHHDRVGLVVFSGGVERVVIPQAGRGALPRLMEAVVDLQPRDTFSNYRAAVETVAVRVRRRSLVVLFTDISDPDATRDLAKYVPLLRPGHLPVCVAFRDPSVAALAETAPGTRAALYDHAAALELQQEWRQVLGQLRKDGVGIVDVLPEDAAVAAVNKYLELKKRQVL